jgi:hypothetical protein
MAVPRRATVYSNIEGRETGSKTASTAALRSIRQPYPAPLDLRASVLYIGRDVAAVA